LDCARRRKQNDRSWEVGNRDAVSAFLLMEDVQSRVKGRMQITTDGHNAYITAVEGGLLATTTDFAQLVKLYGTPAEGAGAETSLQPVNLYRRCQEAD